MDVDLLAKMLGELVLRNSEVGLPGLGTFVVEMVPASFSDRGYTINPPYKRLSFHPGRGEDNLLIELYAASNKIDIEAAGVFITNFLSELKEVLKSKKTIVLPGLGRLRATKENNFFFVSDENLDIYPEGFGLEPISLKTHQETAAEISHVVSTLASIVTGVPAEAEVAAEVHAGPVASVASPAKSAAEVAAEPVTSSESPAELAVETPAEFAVETSSEPELVELQPEEASSTAQTVEAGAAGRQVSEVPTSSEEKVSEVQTLAEPSVEAVEPQQFAVEPEQASEPGEAAAIEPEVHPQESVEPSAVAEKELQAEGSLETPAGQQSEKPSFAPAEQTTTFIAAAETPEPAEAEPFEIEPLPGKRGRRTFQTVLVVILSIIIVLAVALAVFLILSKVTPDFIDSILYTPEELRILNY